MSNVCQNVSWQIGITETRVKQSNYLKPLNKTRKEIVREKLYGTFCKLKSKLGPSRNVFLCSPGVHCTRPTGQHTQTHTGIIWLRALAMILNRFSAERTLREHRDNAFPANTEQHSKSRLRPTDESRARAKTFRPLTRHLTKEMISITRPSRPPLLTEDTWLPNVLNIWT